MPKGIYKRTLEHRKNLSLSHKGKKSNNALEIWHLNGGKPWNKGISVRLNPQYEFKKGFTPWNKGKPHLVEEKNPMWKGKQIGYTGLHQWVVRKLGQPDTCEFCGKTGLVNSQIQWANKSHLYLRNLSDWLRLCVKCHRQYDLVN